MSKVRERAKRRALNLIDRLPPNVRPWYQAARPRSLPATYAALLIGGGIALAHDKFDVIRFVLALIGALMLQIASNFVNEYVDYQRGTDEKKVAGMGMVLTNAQLTARQVLIGAVVTVVGGALIGLILTFASGPALLLVGGIGVAAVVLYTAGPLPLSYIGLGELTAFLCFGPLMTYGTYYAVTGISGMQAALAGLPIGFTVAAILHANNMRDIEPDKAAGKITLAVRFGQQGARIEFIILIYGAYMAALGLIVAGALPWPLLILLATAPEAVWLVRVATTTDDPQALHRVQGRTARLHWWFGLTQAIGWLVFALIT